MSHCVLTIILTLGLNSDFVRTWQISGSATHFLQEGLKCIISASYTISLRKVPVIRLPWWLGLIGSSQLTCKLMHIKIEGDPIIWEQQNSNEKTNKQKKQTENHVAVCEGIYIDS